MYPLSNRILPFKQPSFTEPAAASISETEKNALPQCSLKLCPAENKTAGRKEAAAESLPADAGQPTVSAPEHRPPPLAAEYRQSACGFPQTNLKIAEKLL